MIRDVKPSSLAALQWSGSIHRNPYNDVTTSAMASQITTLTTVYSTVNSRHRLKKPSMLHLTGLRVGNSPVTGEFPAQWASNAENVSIWWRHHVYQMLHYTCKLTWNTFHLSYLITISHCDVTKVNRWHHNSTTVFILKTQIAEFMGPTWGPPGSFRPQMGPMLAPWILLSGNQSGATGLQWQDFHSLWDIQMFSLQTSIAIFQWWKSLQVNKITSAN